MFNNNINNNKIWYQINLDIRRIEYQVCSLFGLGKSRLVGFVRGAIEILVPQSLQFPNQLNYKTF